VEQHSWGRWKHLESPAGPAFAGLIPAHRNPEQGLAIRQRSLTDSQPGRCHNTECHRLGSSLNVIATVSKLRGYPRRCLDCKGETKLIKRFEMTGQEKYESDKQRKEVETMIENKRKTADQHDTDAKGGDDTAKHFKR
jgi:hypothetical protein